ncbi:amylo-alpha-1,6-glucosidase [Microbacterium sp. Root166]|uniref:amylo-alpha-1,6-glucosidase n=1 Tax=Microbacterium sp. Root166 TaxID=1736478 RepID=UPI0006F65D94|nr:glycogen debranching N-terminal domain-containing protein [Microbacterium sp. Root166]KQZ85585.1 amylo-alpha-1,6-glucosidase [Microbacterium sp. Root166]
MAGWNADTLAPPVGAGSVTILEGSSFCTSAANGDIVPDLPYGLFFRDTRIVSRWVLLIDGAPVESLSSLTPEPYHAVFVGRAGHLPGRADTPLTVERDRHVNGGLRERLTIRSYSNDPMSFRVEMLLEADFADIFEVKEGRARGIPRPTRRDDSGRFRVDAVGMVDPLGLVVQAPEATVARDRIAFRVVLPPRGSWTQLLVVCPTVNGEEVTLGPPVEGPLQHEEPVRRLLAWQSGVPVASMEDGALERVVRQSQRDLGSLRIFDPNHTDRAVVAAGVPWFMALFGRDSLLTAYMALPLDPTLALGTLQTLADLQGTAWDPASEEQPGRILHEVRLGATTNLALGGESVYYGTIDATPLFVVVLGELARWGGLPDDAGALLQAADRALEWIERDGDRDGDGFVEYARLNDFGLINQGWKDSWDGVNFADGSLADPPIALCEVQGYVYAAYRARALLATMSGEASVAREWDAKADELKVRFNERFWIPDRGWYAIALDGDKRQVDACASNMGHCLWTGIVDDDKAPRVAEALMSQRMFTGWGVRTLASDMGAYNPASYHNGSVWPHDNAIVAAGLMRYGFVEEAQRITVGLFEAANRYGGRLPELFCGFDQEEYPEPVVYPASCSPQAWAAAAPLSLLRTVLRFDPSVPSGEVWVAPALPPEFGDVHLRNVPFAGSRVSVDVAGDTTTIEGLPDHLTLHHEPRGARTASSRRRTP